ncbi:MAG: SIMPL domain-containing protein, partial [Lachnospiraceae bacterium]
MNEMITVTGKGKISLPPDLIQINISLEIVRDGYEETMGGSAEYISILRDTLKTEGFEKEDIKTVRFNVDLEYESYKERDTWK